MADETQGPTCGDCPGWQPAPVYGTALLVGGEIVALWGECPRRYGTTFPGMGTYELPAVHRDREPCNEGPTTAAELADELEQVEAAAGLHGPDFKREGGSDDHRL